MKKSIYGNVERAEDGTYTTVLVISGFPLEDFNNLVETLHDQSDEDTFVTMPVIRELEDPDFMAELERRLAEVKDGSAKTYSWEEVRKMLLIGDEDGQEWGRSG